MPPCTIKTRTGHYFLGSILGVWQNLRSRLSIYFLAGKRERLSRELQSWSALLGLTNFQSNLCKLKPLFISAYICFTNGMIKLFHIMRWNWCGVVFKYRKFYEVRTFVLWPYARPNVQSLLNFEYEQLQIKQRHFVMFRFGNCRGPRNYCNSHSYFEVHM